MAILTINNKTYDAIYFESETGGYYLITTEPFPRVGEFRRKEIFVSWINQDWFKESVSDFRIEKGYQN